MTITASSIERIWTCPASETLEHCREITGAATQGTDNHGFIRDCITLGYDEALAKAPEDLRPIFAAIDFQALGLAPKAFAAEVAFLYDSREDTAREVGRDIDRGYEALLGRLLEAWEIAGTADAVAVSEARKHGVVIDWKTSWQTENTTPARRNKQLRFLALAIARAYGLESMTVAIVHVRGSAPPKFDRDEIGFFDLEAIADEVREQVVAKVAEERRNKAAGRPQTFTISPACRYCPAKRSCPANLSLVRALVSGEAEVKYRIDQETPPEQVGVAYEMLIAAERVVKMLKESCEIYADDCQVPTPSGKVLCRVLVKGKPRYDADAVWKFLNQGFGPEVADKAIERKTSMAAVGRALKGHCELHRKKITLVTKDVKAGIERIGAVSRSSRQAVRLVAADSPRIVEEKDGNGGEE